MKKIAIFAKHEKIVCEAIVKYFQNKDIKIICIPPMPKEEMFEYFSSHDFDLIALCDYAEELEPKVIELGRFINLHPSLLPAFKGKDAMTRAFTSGVKVSGITVHWITNELGGGKIIAQYPVLIGNQTHFDEFKNAMQDLECKIYPIVIEKVLEDKVFDFNDLFSGGCGENCGGCGGCEK